jgi:hypothetical protein
MVKIDTYKKAFDEIHQTGAENASLIPQVDNWCKHLNIECFSRGMVAQSANLVNEVSLTCQHASHPVKLHSISYVAEEFIRRNCLNCSFHNVKAEPNYGQKILNKIDSQNEEALIKEKEREATAQKVDEEVKQLIKSGKKKANQTQISILNLVSDLGKDNDREVTAARLYAAAKLDPGFFSDAALEVLLFHFMDEKAGRDCIRTVNAVSTSRKVPFQKVFDVASSQILESPYFDDLAGILSLFINERNVSEITSILEDLIDRMWYKRSVGEPANPDRNFKNSEALLIRIGAGSPKILKDLLEKQLSIDEKNKRVNINYLLQRLFENLPELISELTFPLIKSLELTDDQYEESADYVTINTICMLAKAYPDDTIAKLKEQVPSLSVAAQQTAIKINIKLVSDRVFADHNPSISVDLTDKLFGQMLNKGVVEEIKDEASEQLSYLVGDRPELFLSRFDGFLGYLSEIAERDKLFEHYNNEINTKQPHEYTTFNFLIGKNFIEIENERLKITKKYRDVKKILGKLCKSYPAQNLPKVYSLIPELDSEKDEKYKLELLSIVMDNAKDPLVIAGFIPQFYLHLLDPNSLNIRYKALLYLARLVDSFPMTITSTLWDLFEVFIAGKEVLAKGTSLLILGNIATQMPEKINSEHLTIHRESLVNSNVFIHNSAISICEDLHPMMSEAQREEILVILLQLAEVYSQEENKSQLITIVEQIAKFGTDRPKLIFKVSEKFLLPLTDSDDYYEAKERIGGIEELIEQFPNVEPLWLKGVIGFLIRFPNNGGSHDDRVELFFKMHHLSEETIVALQSEFSTLLSLPRTAIQSHLDIAHILHLHGYFGLYETVIKMTVSIEALFPNVAANIPLLRTVKFWNEIANAEIESKPDIKMNHLKEARNVYNKKR